VEGALVCALCDASSEVTADIVHFVDLLMTPMSLPRLNVFVRFPFLSFFVFMFLFLLSIDMFPREFKN